MEALKNAVVSVCMLGCAVGLVSRILPGNALARQMQFLVSLLFAVSLAVPLLQFRLPPDLEGLAQEELALRTQEMDERVQDALLAQTQTLTQQALLRALTEAGITCTALDVELHIDGEGCIHISKVAVTCDDFAGANAVLSDLLGEEADICVTQILTDAG